MLKSPKSGKESKSIWYDYILPISTFRNNKSINILTTNKPIYLFLLTPRNIIRHYLHIILILLSTLQFCCLFEYFWQIYNFILNLPNFSGYFFLLVKKKIIPNDYTDTYSKNKNDR